MVKVYVFENHKHAQVELSYYDDPNRFVLKKVEEEFNKGKFALLSLGVGLKYYEPVELCRDKNGYFFDGSLLSNTDRSYDSIDSLILGLKGALPMDYPGTKVAVVPVYYTVKKHNYPGLASDSVLTCKFNPALENLASCRGLTWLERKKFGLAYSSLFCF